MLCEPVVSPAPAPKPEKPTRSAPREMTTGPVATTADVDTAVPAEATAPARDRACTVKLSWPVAAPEPAVAVTAALDVVAFIAVQPPGRARSWAADWRVENLELRTW